MFGFVYIYLSKNNDKYDNSHTKMFEEKIFSSGMCLQTSTT